MQRELAARVAGQAYSWGMLRRVGGASHEEDDHAPSRSDQMMSSQRKM